MNAAEIRTIAIDSAKNYYEYLESKKKGTQEVDVFEIEYPNTIDLIIKLRLSAKLFDQESIFFKLLTTNNIYDNNLVKIIEYDSDQNILLIRPNDSVKNEFSHLRKSEIKVISDLKFLVKRVEDWYTINGANVGLPTNKSSLAHTINAIKFLEDFPPSENQIDSIKSIFSNPFTYAWGAPGTGKTQFVLAYAMLHYITNNKRIAILAPTNNSLEQMLRGVLKMIDIAGIDRKQILRLGTPSRTFAEDYPEICEEKGVQKKLDEIEKQIKIINNVILYYKNIENIKLATHNLTLFDNFPLLQERHHSAKIESDNFSDAKKLKLSEISLVQDNLNNVQTKRELVQKAINSLSHKIKKLITSSPTLQEQELSVIDLQIFSIQKSLQNHKNQLSEIVQELNSKVAAQLKVNGDIAQLISAIKTSFKNLSLLEKVSSKLKFYNWKLNKAELVIALDSLKLDKYTKPDLLEDYKHHSLVDLQNILSNYQDSCSKLKSISTEERLENINIIACTLDYYIGKFVKSKMKVEHIFLDEAGYANIIKSLTLFNHSVPITFLGDHKQLPPVCEINDFTIKNEPRYNNMFLWAQSSIYIETLFNNIDNFALHQYLYNYPLSPVKLVTTSLNSTYRFGTNLTKILGKHIYDTKFRSENPEGVTKIFHIHASKTEEYNSRISYNEVQEIVNIIKKLKNNGNNDFIILTPYKKQVKLLGQHLPLERNELKILTVHGSQGREWDTVILSVVDTNDKWFVDSLLPKSKGLNLINTAVSRAKNQLILVCDIDYWSNQNGQLITDLIKSGTALN